MAQSPVLLELIAVAQRYSNRQRTFVAVENINFSLHEGEFVAILGPSGCGKSTLLRIIAGLQKPSGGRVLYRGQPLSGVNPYATIVFQTFALFPWFSVLENVALALKARGIPPTVRLARTMELLDRVGLDGFESAYPRELSGGMRQKVGFARAMALNPELLCLDEPFSALDVLSAETLRSELVELWIGGKIPTKAILLVTHHIEEAVFLADRIVVMDKGPGRIVADLSIPLSHPRFRHAPAFTALVDQVYSLLAGQTKAEPVELGSAPGEPGVTRGLPQVSIGHLTGLLEHLARLSTPHADIYRLPEQLGVNSDAMLRLVEAAELLGFVTVQNGDVALTALGDTFAAAGILGRKGIFAVRICRLPLIRWLLTLLHASENHCLTWDVVHIALELEFPPGEAQHQLDTIVDWGRYAEVLAYDDSRALITLEPEGLLHLPPAEKPS